MRYVVLEFVKQGPRYFKSASRSSRRGFQPQVNLPIKAIDEGTVVGAGLVVNVHDGEGWYCGAEVTILLEQEQAPPLSVEALGPGEPQHGAMLQRLAEGPRMVYSKLPS